MNLFSKKTLLAISLLTFGISNAQFTLYHADGSVIEDESVFSFGTTDEETAKLEFHIQNDASNSIGMKARMLEIDGSDGSNVQFCLGDCLFNINEDSIVPVNAPFSIAVGQTLEVGTYFWNRNESSDYIVYRFKVYQVDNLGNETGEPIHITYIYDASLSVPGTTLQQMGVAVNNTLVKNAFSFSSENNLTVEVFDLNGKNVANYKTEAGQQTLDLSSLQNAVYIVKFASKEGKTAYSKIVKQ
jgi:hypothetical protein